MTVRLLACVECDECHVHFEKLASIQGLHSEALAEEVHQLVLAAEDHEWGCRKNATEHICSCCIERMHNPF